jgi:hypothetical protein
MDSGVAAVSIGGNDTCIILRNQTGAGWLPIVFWGGSGIHRRQ